MGGCLNCSRNPYSYINEEGVPGDLEKSENEEEDKFVDEGDNLDEGIKQGGRMHKLPSIYDGKIQRQESLLVCLEPIHEGNKIIAAYEDTMAHDSLNAGLVSLPSLIPDAPIKCSKDLGSIYFSISYNASKKLLKVFIQRAERLPAKDVSGSSDPFVRIILLPNKKQELQTSIKKKNLNPEWNEIFIFEGFTYAKVMEKTLLLQVVDHDKITSNEKIGEVVLPLADVRLEMAPEDYTRNLRPIRHSSGWQGDLLVSMCYKSEDSCLDIIIMKGNKLRSMDMNGKSDPYVKVYLMSFGDRIMKRSTSVKEECLDPVWNELMVFEIPSNIIRDIYCIFTVMDYNKTLSNRMIGKVVIGPQSSGTAIRHWVEVTSCPMTPVAMWHGLVK